MSKTYIDEFIKNMKKAGMVAKASPWSVEGFGQGQMNIRYVGLNLKDDWTDIFSLRDHVLLKFIVDRQSASIWFFIANKPPFTKFFVKHFDEGEKWEAVIGEVKRRLKRDKAEFLHHQDKIGNIFAHIAPLLKS